MPYLSWTKFCYVYLVRCRWQSRLSSPTEIAFLQLEKATNIRSFSKGKPLFSTDGKPRFSQPLFPSLHQCMSSTGRNLWRLHCNVLLVSMVVSSFTLLFKCFFSFLCYSCRTFAITYRGDKQTRTSTISTTLASGRWFCEERKQRHLQRRFWMARWVPKRTKSCSLGSELITITSLRYLRREVSWFEKLKSEFWSAWKRSLLRFPAHFRRRRLNH